MKELLLLNEQVGYLPTEFTKAAPLLRPDLKGEWWTVEEDFIWFFDEKYSGRYVIVPKGFESDLASVPKILRNIVPHTTAPAASVVHDYCYRYPLIMNYVGKDDLGLPISKITRVSRKEIDINYKMMNIASGVSNFKSSIMYRGVRIGGNSTYQRYRKTIDPTNILM